MDNTSGGGKYLGEDLAIKAGLSKHPQGNKVAIEALRYCVDKNWLIETKAGIDADPLKYTCYETYL